MPKIIFDPVHGPMPFSDLIVQAIDTPAFQRLRHIKQLGCCSLVFPSATHTRFEHSLGVTHLAGQMMRGLQTRQPELQIDEHLIDLVQLAALCHDLGHGPFSHVFDDRILPSLPEGVWNRPLFHEERSQQILREDIAPTLGLTDEETTLVAALIHPTDEDLVAYGWVVQIVADPISGVDVDKFDYIARDAHHIGIPMGFVADRILLGARVIDGFLAYPEKNIYELDMLFATRFRLHQQVYHHRVSIAVEEMLSEVLVQLATLRPSWFRDWRTLTDNLVERIRYDGGQDLASLVSVLDAIEHRKLPTCLYHGHTQPKDAQGHRIIKVAYGYRQHPLENLFWYKRTKPTHRFRMEPNEMPATSYNEIFLVLS